MSFIKEDLECFHPDDLEEMDIQHSYAMLSIRAKRFYSRTGRPIPKNARHQEQIQLLLGQDKLTKPNPDNNNKLLLQFKLQPVQLLELLSSTGASSMKSCLSTIKLLWQTLQRYHLRVSSDEITYKEKINCLKKEISSLKHEQTNLETQIDDLLYKSVPPPTDYIAIYEPSFNIANLDTANRNLDPSTDEPFVEDCTTSSESESTYSDHDETSAAPSEAVLNRMEES
ncbi:hypothetical protein L1987_18930 [Smallanthus sonchifolius]|uniref:Uncharacterized protein n=1 Tax=Smallanthus sonchifolius TaxID=185202 RepID=A0ACB9J4K1_9ASTR|nr:hypothetical protein L1987_18930 [Smallanthus sonchifolius]